MSSTGVELRNAFINETFNDVDMDVTTIPFGASLYVALHTADPAGGTQLTSELSTSGYAAYTRQAVTRAPGAGGWTYSQIATSAVNSSNVSFPARAESGSDPVATHWSIGRDSTGAGKLLFSGPVLGSGSLWLHAMSRDSIAANTFEVTSAPGIGSFTYTEGDAIYVMAHGPDSLPTSLVQATKYFIANGTLETGAGVPTTPLASANIVRFKLATVSGAGTVAPMGQDGGLLMVKPEPVTISQGVSFTFNANALKFFEG